MAGNREGRRRGPGRPFAPGNNANPSGLSKSVREKRLAVSQALDEALVVKEIIDGTETRVDLLVAAIVAGVREREPSLVRLACEYRWGKPVQAVAVEPEQMSDDEIKLAVVELARELEGEGLPQ